MVRYEAFPTKRELIWLYEENLTVLYLRRPRLNFAWANGILVGGRVLPASFRERELHCDSLSILRCNMRASLDACVSEKWCRFVHFSIPEAGWIMQGPNRLHHCSWSWIRSVIQSWTEGVSAGVRHCHRALLVNNKGFLTDGPPHWALGCHSRVFPYGVLWHWTWSLA